MVIYGYLHINFRLFPLDYDGWVILLQRVVVITLLI